MRSRPSEPPVKKSGEPGDEQRQLTPAAWPTRVWEGAAGLAGSMKLTSPARLRAARMDPAQNTLCCRSASVGLVHLSGEEVHGWRDG